MKRIAIALVLTLGLVAITASTESEPVAAPAPPPAPAAKPAPPPPPKLDDAASCDRRSDCKSNVCCATMFGSICAKSCAYNDVKFPGAEPRCESDAECKKGETCFTRATVGSKIIKVCAKQ